MTEADGSKANRVYEATIPGIQLRVLRPEEQLLLETTNFQTSAVLTEKGKRKRRNITGRLKPIIVGEQGC